MNIRHDTLMLRKIGPFLGCSIRPNLVLIRPWTPVIRPIVNSPPGLSIMTSAIRCRPIKKGDKESRRKSRPRVRDARPCGRRPPTPLEVRCLPLVAIYVHQHLGSTTIEHSDAVEVRRHRPTTSRLETEPITGFSSLLK